jgi:hypothetical protein
MSKKEQGCPRSLVQIKPCSQPIFVSKGLLEQLVWAVGTFGDISRNRFEKFGLGIGDGTGKSGGLI